MKRHRYEERIKVLEDEVGKLMNIASLVCPHRHVEWSDNNYGYYSKRCRDCGKRLDSYETYQEWLRAKTKYGIKEQEALLEEMEEK